MIYFVIPCFIALTWLIICAILYQWHDRLMPPKVFHMIFGRYPDEPRQITRDSTSVIGAAADAVGRFFTWWFKMTIIGIVAFIIYSIIKEAEEKEKQEQEERQKKLKKQQDEEREIAREKAALPPSKPARNNYNSTIQSDSSGDEDNGGGDDYSSSDDDDYQSLDSSHDPGSQNDEEDASEEGDDSDHWRRKAGIAKCEECDGDQNHWIYGDIGNGVCSQCHGSGAGDFIDQIGNEDSTCEICGGPGKCPACKGEGFTYID